MCEDEGCFSSSFLHLECVCFESCPVAHVTLRQPLAVGTMCQQSSLSFGKLAVASGRELRLYRALHVSSFNTQIELCWGPANRDQPMRLAVLPDFMKDSALKYGEDIHMLATAGVSVVSCVELKEQASMHPLPGATGANVVPT